LEFAVIGPNSTQIIHSSITVPYRCLYYRLTDRQHSHETRYRPSADQSAAASVTVSAATTPTWAWQPPTMMMTTRPTSRQLHSRRLVLYTRTTRYDKSAVFKSELIKCVFSHLVHSVSGTDNLRSEPRPDEHHSSSAVGCSSKQWASTTNYISHNCWPPCPWRDLCRRCLPMMVRRLSCVKSWHKSPL